MTDWEPMETAPRDGTRVLVAFDTAFWRGAEVASWEVYPRGKWKIVGHYYPEHFALGWQPLPPMPEGKVTAGGAE